MRRGRGTDGDLEVVLQAGYRDAKVMEIVAVVAMKVLTTYSDGLVTRMMQREERKETPMIALSNTIHTYARPDTPMAEKKRG